MKLKYIQTIDFTFNDIYVLNCNTMENLMNKIKENEVIKINNEGSTEYINSSYIMYFG